MVIDGTFTRQINLLSSIWVLFSPCKLPLMEGRLSEDVENGSLFSYVQCDFGVLQNLPEKFSVSPPIFTNVNVSRDDICPQKEDYNEEEGLWLRLAECWNQAVSQKSEESLHGCCSFIWVWGWYAKILWFCAMQCNEMLQPFHSVCSECLERGDDEFPSSSVAAETMKFLGSSFYDNQIMEWSRHAVTKYLSDEKHLERWITKYFSALVN